MALPSSYVIATKPPQVMGQRGKGYRVRQGSGRTMGASWPLMAPPWSA